MRARRLALFALGSFGTLALTTAALLASSVASPTTVALSYLLVVLFTASFTTLAVAVATSVAAMLSLNFFFMPPVGTFTIVDPHNWVALLAFLVVAVVASHLSSTARARAADAVERRREVTRLFDVTRDVLLTTDGDGALSAVARHVARRFELPVVTLAVPAEPAGWRVVHGGVEEPDTAVIGFDRAWATARGVLEFDAQTRSYGGHRSFDLPAGPAVLVPIRAGVRPVGLAVLGGRTLEPGTADAIAGVVAIALERARFLEDRRTADLSRQRADLTSALLAALGHDLRTPLTAIRIAVTNAGDPALPAEVRVEQTSLAVSELDHLARLLQEILDLARIQTHAVRAEPQWVTAGSIVEAAAAHAGTALSQHSLRVETEEGVELQLDPRLTSAALAHVLENAAKYSPPGTAIEVKAACTADGFRVAVTDEGPGLRDEDLEGLFEPFVRGSAGRRTAGGTGLGLTITRGLLAAQGGRVWADRAPSGGARFSLLVPAATRAIAQEART